MTGLNEWINKLIDKKAKMNYSIDLAYNGWMTEWIWPEWIKDWDEWKREWDREIVLNEWLIEWIVLAHND